MRRVSAARLLGKLAGGVVPVDPPEGSDDRAFGALLRPMLGDAISFAPGIDTGSLDDDALERAREALDAASREGFDHALLDIGATAVRVDVRRRRVEARFAPGEGFVVGGIDGVVRAASEPEATEHEDSEHESGDEQGDADRAETRAPAILGPVPYPARVVRNASLAEALVLDDVPDA